MTQASRGKEKGFTVSCLLAVLLGVTMALAGGSNLQLFLALLGISPESLSALASQKSGIYWAFPSYSGFFKSNHCFPKHLSWCLKFHFCFHLKTV